MSMTENEIVTRISELYPKASIEVAGEDCSFEVYIVCDDFADMRTLHRQQAILSLFADELASGKLHALGVKAKTHAELSSNAGLVQIV